MASDDLSLVLHIYTNDFNIVTLGYDRWKNV